MLRSSFALHRRQVRRLPQIGLRLLVEPFTLDLDAVDLVRDLDPGFAVGATPSGPDPATRDRSGPARRVASVY